MVSYFASAFEWKVLQQLYLAKQICDTGVDVCCVQYWYFLCAEHVVYRNFPKFSDRQIWANSADPDQTAPTGAVLSGSTLFAIPSASFGCITLRKSRLVKLLG